MTKLYKIKNRLQKSNLLNLFFSLIFFVPQVHAMASAFGRGLRVLGLKPGEKISLYAETRAEWMVGCLGAFSQNVHVCTVYTNLGDEAVIHALNETQVRLTYRNMTAS